MEQIIALFNKHQDKVYHFVMGQAIAVLFLPITWWLSIIAVVLVGVGKEVWDSKGNGTVEVWDAIVTVLGGLFVVGLYLL